MRVLFGTPPGLGHFLPVVPLAWAARAGGHMVRVVTSGAALLAAVRAGLPAVGTAPDRDGGRALDCGGFDQPDSIASHTDGRWPVVGSQAVHYDERVVELAIQAIVSWRPDLIVHTLGDFMAPTAAAMNSIPLVLHGLGLPPTGSSAMPAPPELRSIFRRLGFDAQPASAIAALDTCPPSMREPDRPAAWPMRYVPYNGGGALPDWLLGQASRPRVCVTLGTVVPMVAGTDCYRPVIDAMRDLDVQVILLLGDADPTALGTVPDNVRCARWLPLSELLPRCAAIVHHAGAGTTMSAVVAGTPQLALPYRETAAIVSRGIGLTPDDLEPATISRAVQRLLQEPVFGRAAHEVSLENSTLPSPAAVLTRLAGSAVVRGAVG